MTQASLCNRGCAALSSYKARDLGQLDFGCGWAGCSHPGEGHSGGGSATRDSSRMIKVDGVGLESTQQTRVTVN